MDTPRLRLPLLPRRATSLLPLALPMMLSLGGCHVFSLWDPTHMRRGELIDAESLKDLTPGVSTRADAQSVLGTPTARATFDDNTWIYITQITSTRIARTPGVTMQQVLVLKFDPLGTLVSLRQLSKEDGKQIAMAPGATPSPGSEASFMQQLLGNVGRFTPAGLPGSGGSLGPTSGNTLP